MSKRSLLLLLVFWNVLLTAAIVWSLTRARVPMRVLKDQLTELKDTAVPPIPRDTAGLADGRIAFFFMDSVQSKFELVKESADRVRSEGKRMENALQAEMQKAQDRYNELMGKDHTYSTQAELKSDQDEIAELGAKIQDMRSNSQDRLDQMQTRMLQEITSQIQGFLEEYNRTTGYDFIFSIQDGGQIWVGNKGLDITSDVVSGLNKRHHLRNAAPAK
jgi:Skp family chaperone for outer membrane proteins